MATFYVPPPTDEDLAYQWMQEFARGRRIKLSVTIEHRNGDVDTQVIDQRRKEE